MNPYQQPHNNAPYYQNPGYPQLNGPSKYPTLPPIQNQNSQYPPHQPQYNPYNPQTRPNGYQPPAQYGNIQSGSNKNEERQKVVKEIADLEQEFNTCFMNFYKFWLYLTAFLSTVTFVSNLFAYSRGRNHSGVLESLVASFFIMGWNVAQSYYGLTAISQKSLKKANVACWMTTIALIPWLISEIALIVAVVTYHHGGSENFYGVLLCLTGLVTLVVLFHVGLVMNGAFKVRKILAERELLQEKLSEIDYAFRA